MKTLKIILLIAFIIGYLPHNMLAQTNGKSTMIKKSKSPADRNYEKAEKALQSVKEALNQGNVHPHIMKGNIEEVEKFINWTLKADPNYDVSVVRNELENLKEGASSQKNNAEEWRKTISTFENYYNPNYSINVDATFFNSSLEKDAESFDLGKIKQALNEQKQNGGLTEQEQALEDGLNDYGNFLNKAGVIDAFMQKLDEAQPRAGSSNPAVTINKVETVKNKAIALQAFAGRNNAELNSVINAANKMIETQEREMGNAITSDLHKKYLGKIVFSSQPLNIGSAKESDLTSVFVSGDAIYGTVYFGRSLKDMLKTANFTKNGVTNFDFQLYKNGNSRIVPEAEKWEIDSYAFHDDITVRRDELGQSYIQFVLVPKDPNELSNYVKAHNYTPVIFSRMLSAQTPRKIDFKLKFNYVDFNGFNQTFEGEFAVDLSQGEGSTYYKKLENKLIDKYIEDNELPNAGMKNTTLEQQMIAEMNSKGWQENFVKAIIEQGNWTVEKNALGQPVRKIINAFMVAKHPDGYCFYHNYGFESLPTGSGWGKPQYRSSGARTRILCNKLK